MLALSAATVAWQPAPSPLVTRWASDVHPDQATPYPRPELTRGEGSWRSLNGLWEVDYSVADLSEPPFGKTLGQQILVPYPIESPLSGIRNLTAHGYLFYRLVVNKSQGCTASAARTLLHFEAVDWRATVWADGSLLGTHEGGYTPFSFSLTEAFAANRNVELVVGVFDPTDSAAEGIPVGKQNLAAFHDQAPGNRYVPTSGIWQTVWLECVGDDFMTVTPVPSVELGDRRSTEPGAPSTSTPARATVRFQIEIDSTTVLQPLAANVTVADPLTGALPAVLCPAQAAATSLNCSVELESPRLWSPSTPLVYQYTVSLHAADGARTGCNGCNGSALAAALDRVAGSFVVRHVGLAVDGEGLARPTLNGEVIYTLATLDQGFWPDGAHAAPTDEALASDLLALKALGFNAVRKHIKSEPRRWYWHAERIGLMVWQDFVSPSKFIHPVTDTMAARQLSEGAELVRSRRHFGAIVAWVIYNEAWGLAGRPPEQPALGVAAAREADAALMSASGRLVDACTGCEAHGAGDAIDAHHYPTPAAPATGGEPGGRFLANGEFGGIGLALSGHEWVAGGCHGYGGLVPNGTALTDAYVAFAGQIVELILAKGLSVSVYTQTSDCERECNGVLTYDRVLKPDVERWAAASARILAAAARAQRAPAKNAS